MKMKFTIFTLSCFALLCLIEAQTSYNRAQYSRANNNNNNNAYLASPYDESGANRYRQAQPQSGSGSSSYGPSPKPYRNQNSADSYGTSSGSNTAKNAEEAAAEEEEEKKPTRLEILLQQSKFTCANRKNGYYSDSTVNCEVFHYCVDGAKHSWMCPENTVFHQVHLNCVPASLDICGETDKYSSQVNDYLHKPLDQRGPNNTVLYHQRYYPEEFLGDALLNNVPAIQHFGYAPGTEPQAPRAQPQSVSQPRAQPQARPVSRPNYATYDNSNDDDDDQPAYRPVQPQPVAQPRPVSRPQSSYSPYQNIAAPKPSIPQPINKPVAIAPAPQPYLANYRPVTSTLPRRPEYSSYQPSAPKPASYSSYPSSSSSASSSPLLSNIPVSLQNYKLTPTSYNSNNRAQPFKPTSSSPVASYPISYSPSAFDSSSSRYNFGTSTGTTTPLRADGVTYEEEY